MCIGPRDRLVNRLIPPSIDLSAIEREEMMSEFAKARSVCGDCWNGISGDEVGSCFSARRMTLEMKGPQLTDAFPSIFDICAAELEEELAIKLCEFCNGYEAYDWQMFDESVPPRRVKRWIRDEQLNSKLAEVDIREFTPPWAKIAGVPALKRRAI